MSEVKQAVTQMALVRIDPQLLLAKAVESNASIETLERLVALAKDVREVQAREAWHEAMAEFQRRCPAIKKTRTAEIQSLRGYYKYNYAPLDEIMETIRPLLGELGFSVSWSSRVEPQRVIVFCRIAHVLGHTESSGDISMPIPDASEKGGGNPAQRVGSALTYARRYSLLQVTGLTPEDDDDAHAVDKDEAEKSREGEPGKSEPRSRPVVFPFGKHKDEMPDSLTLADLRKEEGFWAKRVTEEENPAYKASNQRLLDAIKEAIAEKTAKPESPAAPEKPTEQGAEGQPSPPAGDVPSSDAGNPNLAVEDWKREFSEAENLEKLAALWKSLEKVWSHFKGPEQVGMKREHDKRKSVLMEQTGKLV